MPQASIQHQENIWNWALRERDERHRVTQKTQMRGDSFVDHIFYVQISSHKQKIYFYFSTYANHRNSAFQLCDVSSEEKTKWTTEFNEWTSWMNETIINCDTLFCVPSQFYVDISSLSRFAGSPKPKTIIKHQNVMSNKPLTVTSRTPSNQMTMKRRLRENTFRSFFKRKSNKNKKKFPATIFGDRKIKQSHASACHSIAFICDFSAIFSSSFFVFFRFSSRFRFRRLRKVTFSRTMSLSPELISVFFSSSFAWPFQQPALLTRTQLPHVYFGD